MAGRQIFVLTPEGEVLQVYDCTPHLQLDGGRGRPLTDPLFPLPDWIRQVCSVRGKLLVYTKSDTVDLLGWFALRGL